MFSKIFHRALLLFVILSLLACKASEEDTLDAKETAWNFLAENRWNNEVKGGNWKNAEVTKVTVSNDYFLLDERYDGKEVLAVSFEANENLFVGPPTVIISLDTNEAIGYMPNE